MPLQLETIELDSRHSFRLLHWKDNLREVDSVLGPEQRSRIHGAGDRWHHHREMELTIVQRGSGTRFVGDHIGPFDSLDVVLIGASVPHFWRGLRRSSGYAVQWRFERDHPLWRFPETRSLGKLWELSAHGLRFTGATARRALASVERMAESEGCARLALLFELLGNLAAAPRRERVELSHRPFDLSGSHALQPSIERVIRYILQHFRQPIPLSEVLRLAGMSKATFARQFRRHAGRPFSAFVNQVRLDHACRELVGSGASVSESAFASGFNSLSYFNRTFRNAHGCSPKEYRRKAMVLR
jgi:AraC-like DNA-binding protein